MADLTVLSTGKTFYQLDDGIAALILEMFPAAVERAKRSKPVPVASVPQCGIGRTLSGFAFVKWTLDARNEIYDGPPAGLVAFFAKMNITLPAEIVERYASVWEPRPLKLSQEE